MDMTYSGGQRENGASGADHPVVEPPPPAVLEYDPERKNEHEQREALREVSTLVSRDSNKFKLTDISRFRGDGGSDKVGSTCSCHI